MLVFFGVCVSPAWAQHIIVGIDNKVFWDADGKLVTVLDDFHCAEELAMLAIYPHERHRLPRVAAMLDFLTETFSQRPWRTAGD